MDGDQYFVSFFYCVLFVRDHLLFSRQTYWGEEFQLLTTVEPLEYSSQSGKVRSTPVTAMNVIDYCLASMTATSHGEIYNLHAVVADKNKENHPQRTCQKLAIELAIMFAAASEFTSHYPCQH